MTRDPYGLELSGLPPELFADARALRNREQIAQAMIAQGAAPLGGARSAGRYMVKPSWAEGAAKLAETAVGSMNMADTERAYRSLGDRRAEMEAQAVREYQQRKYGTPQAPLPPATPNDDQGNPMPAAAMPNAGADPRGAVESAMLSRFPALQRLGALDLATINRQEDRADTQAYRTAEAKAAREQRAADAAEADRRRSHEAATARSENAASREAMIRTAASLRQPPQTPAPSITQIIDPLKPDQMISIDTRVFKEEDYKKGNRAGVIGTSGKEPTAAKREDKAAEGKDLLKVELDNLREHYRVLNEARAIPSDARGGVSNLGASIQSSGFGQLAGRTFATKEQTARNEIQSSRLRVLNAVKNATGMSAQQLNSNAELKTWLDSLTDPTKSYESNVGIINAIDDAFVKGKGKTPRNDGVKILRFDAQGNTIP